MERVEGQEANLPPLPVQYADYAVAEQNKAELARIDEQFPKWKEHLAGVPALELPTDRPRPPVRSTQGARLEFALDKALTAPLNALAREQGSTLFMVLLAGFAAVLSRHSGQSDFAIGTPVAHRPRLETESVVGFFANTLALRLDLRGQPTVCELLARVRQEALAAYNHQDIPFQRLVEHTQRDTSRSPVFQVMFALQNAGLRTLSAGAVQLQPFSFDPGVARFDLVLDIIERGGQLCAFFEYATSLFDSTTIASLAGHLNQLLHAMVARPEQPVHALPMLAPAERQRIVAEWNQTAVDYPHNVLPHVLFEEHVSRTPNRVALRFGAIKLTYGELNGQANALAQRLRGQGIEPEARVGICLERSLAFVVSLLAVAKVGAAYVPLDPALGPKRIDQILRQSGCCLILTDSGAQEVVRASTVPKWDVAVFQAAPVANLPVVARPSHAACILYPAVSAGMRDGVAVTNGSIVCSLSSIRERTALGDSDIVLWESSPSLDGGLGVFLPLLAGATVGVASPEAASDGHALLRQIDTLGVTFLQATPASWRLLLDAGLDRTRNLRGISFGGEPTLRLAQQLHDATLDAWSAFGTPEATSHVALWQLPKKAGSPSIGQPLGNTRLHVLDDWLEPVPIGVTGDLYVGGDSLARGYVDAPDLTAGTFVPDPLATDGVGQRLCRTRHRARRLRNGDIVLAGLRVDLLEIAAILEADSRVAKALATFVNDSGGKPQLVAYYACIAGEAPATPEEMLGVLRRTLPEPLVPKALIPVSAFALTSAGKIDRSALPKPFDVESAAKPAREYVAPRSAIEELLARIWADILRVDRVSAEEDFFELGGHSLLATQVVARLQKQLNIDVPLRALFRSSAPCAASRARPGSGRGAATGGCCSTWHKHHPAHRAAVVVVRRKRPVVSQRAGAGSRDVCHSRRTEDSRATRRNRLAEDAFGFGGPPRVAPNALCGRGP